MSIETRNWQEHTEVVHEPNGGITTRTTYPMGIFAAMFYFVIAVFLIGCFLKLCWNVSKIKKMMEKNNNSSN